MSSVPKSASRFRGVIKFGPLIGLICALCLALAACADSDGYLPQNGDIIFHTSTSSQSKAIQLATHSAYSHMGIVYIRDSVPYVYEAIQPVKSTPLQQWISRGEGKRYVVKRLKRAEEILVPEVFDGMWRIGEAMQGKDYDLTFEWSDDRIYCSELVWKMYKRGAGVELGSLQNLQQFDFSHDVVKAKIQQRYPNGLPENEPVISPDAIFRSEQLETVFESL